MMSNSPSDPDAAELAALADESLPVEQRETALARVARSPELTAELDEQRRSISVVRSVDVRAPAALQRSVQDMIAAAAPSGAEQRSSARGYRIRWSPPRWPIAAGLSTATAALAVVVVLLLSGGSTGGPSVQQAARLALAPATLASPSESARDSDALTSSVEGISYPYWGARFGWDTAGARTDRLAGHTVTTVFYSNGDAHRIGYSIVGGSALAVPREGRAVQRNGISFRLLHSAGATVVTWREAGHTCILAARDVPGRTLIKLAGWSRA